MERKPPRAFDAPSDENADAQAPASLAATFPFYEEGKVPQYQRYHAEVSYLDELPLIWGKRWGAKGSTAAACGRTRCNCCVIPGRRRFPADRITPEFSPAH